MKDDVVLVVVVLAEETSTGGGVRSRGPSSSYDAGWDRIFGKKDAKHTVN